MLPAFTADKKYLIPFPVARDCESVDEFLTTKTVLAALTGTKTSNGLIYQWAYLESIYNSTNREQLAQQFDLRPIKAIISRNECVDHIVDSIDSYRVPLTLDQVANIFPKFPLTYQEFEPNVLIRNFSTYFKAYKKFIQGATKINLPELPLYQYHVQFTATSDDYALTSGDLAVLDLTKRGIKQLYEEDAPIIYTISGSKHTTVEYSTDFKILSYKLPPIIIKSGTYKEYKDALILIARQPYPYRSKLLKKLARTQPSREVTVKIFKLIQNRDVKPQMLTEIKDDYGIKRYVIKKSHLEPFDIDIY